MALISFSDYFFVFKIEDDKSHLWKYKIMPSESFVDELFFRGLAVTYIWE